MTFLKETYPLRYFKIFKAHSISERIDKTRRVY